MEGIDGHNLWLSREPSAKEVIGDLGSMEGFDEIVFCGFGEPLIKLDELLEIAQYVKSKGKKTRINTNGHANAFHQKDVPQLLKGIIDVVSISLNAATPKHYQKLCRSIYNEEAFNHVISFAKGCVQAGIRTKLSVVDVIGREEIEEARRIAEEVGAEFKVRHHII
jgi:TatD family-associated radical SAM protein